MWHIAFEGWKQRPLLGWGPENFIIIFQRDFDPSYFVPAAGFGAWFDRAHSVIFDYLARRPARSGSLAISSIFVCIFTVFKRKEKPGEHGEKGQQNTRELWVRALFLGLPFAYLVQALVLFDVLPIYLPLFMYFAFAVYRFTPALSAPTARTPQKNNV